MAAVKNSVLDGISTLNLLSRGTFSTAGQQQIPQMVAAASVAQLVKCPELRSLKRCNGADVSLIPSRSIEIRGKIPDMPYMGVGAQNTYKQL